jgi:molybdopterin biosynthesis enzyme MoaB
MVVVRLRIEGQDLGGLVDLLESGLAGRYVSASEELVVLASERFYLRTGSDLLTVVILKLLAKDRYEVEVITGGGGTGPFGITFGAEKHRSSKVVEALEEICRANSWTLMRIPPEAARA